MNNPILTPEQLEKIQNIALRSANATTYSVAQAIEGIFLEGVLKGMELAGNIYSPDRIGQKEHDFMLEQKGLAQEVN